MIGKIIGLGITGLVGFVVIVLGCLIWKKEMIGLFHAYHIDKIPPENKKAFCAISGIGLLIIGISLVMTAIIFGITDSDVSFICFAVGLTAGAGMLILAGLKYNH